MQKELMWVAKDIMELLLEKLKPISLLEHTMEKLKNKKEIIYLDRYTMS